MVNLVFVFGTLKEGFPNFHVNQGERLPGVFATALAFPLYLVGSRNSPWMIDSPGQGHPVAGQVFRVSDAVLAQMDLLERVAEPDGYHRALIEVAAKSTSTVSTVQAFAYLKRATQFEFADAREGPLSEYTQAHAALYRSRGAQ